MYLTTSKKVPDGMSIFRGLGASNIEFLSVLKSFFIA